jgi:hypothetical protein
MSHATTCSHFHTDVFVKLLLTQCTLQRIEHESLMVLGLVCTEGMVVQSTKLIWTSVMPTNQSVKHLIQNSLEYM